MESVTKSVTDTPGRASCMRIHECKITICRGRQQESERQTDTVGGDSRHKRGGRRRTACSVSRAVEVEGACVAGRARRVHVIACTATADGAARRHGTVDALAVAVLVAVAACAHVRQPLEHTRTVLTYLEIGSRTVSANSRATRGRDGFQRICTDIVEAQGYLWLKGENMPQRMTSAVGQHINAPGLSRKSRFGTAQQTS